MPTLLPNHIKDMFPLLIEATKILNSQNPGAHLAIDDLERLFRYVDYINAYLPNALVNMRKENQHVIETNGLYRAFIEAEKAYLGLQYEVSLPKNAADFVEKVINRGRSRGLEYEHRKKYFYKNLNACGLSYSDVEPPNTS